MRSCLLLLAFLCATAQAQVAVEDDYGNTVRLRRPAERIVSLSPHLTELLFAAGAGGRVVGALEHSDFPPAAADLPRIGSEAGIDVEALLALRPDLVVAWPNVGSARTVDRIEALGLPVFRSEPRALDDIARTLERLGALAGTSGVAQREARAFRSRVSKLEKAHASLSRVRVFYQVWDRPLITVNGEHVISKVVRLCGGQNVFAELPLLAPEIDREAVLKANPDAIVASGPGGRRPAWLDEWRAFPGLAAAAHGHLFSIPPELIQRHTPRILEGAEALCAALEQVRRRPPGR